MSDSRASSVEFNSGFCSAWVNGSHQSAFLSAFSFFSPKLKHTSAVDAEVGALFIEVDLSYESFYHRAVQMIFISYLHFRRSPAAASVWRCCKTLLRYLPDAAWLETQ